MIGMRTAAAAAPEPLTPVRSGTRRVVLVSLGLQIPQTAALAVAAILSGSAALVAQTFAATADLAVQAFLVIGVRASSREADESHPVGYGRERYFWALYAALAIFVSGFTVAVAEALRDVVNPTPVASFGNGLPGARRQPTPRWPFVRGRDARDAAAGQGTRSFDRRATPRHDGTGDTDRTDRQRDRLRRRSRRHRRAGIGAGDGEHVARYDREPPTRPGTHGRCGRIDPAEPLTVDGARRPSRSCSSRCDV